MAFATWAMASQPEGVCFGRPPCCNPVKTLSRVLSWTSPWRKRQRWSKAEHRLHSVACDFFASGLGSRRIPLTGESFSRVFSGWCPFRTTARQRIGRISCLVDCQASDPVVPVHALHDVQARCPMSTSTSAPQLKAHFTPARPCHTPKPRPRSEECSCLPRMELCLLLAPAASFVQGRWEHLSRTTASRLRCILPWRPRRQLS